MKWRKVITSKLHVTLPRVALCCVVSLLYIRYFTPCCVPFRYLPLRWIALHCVTLWVELRYVMLRYVMLCCVYVSYIFYFRHPMAKKNWVRFLRLIYNPRTSTFACCYLTIYLSHQYCIYTILYFITIYSITIYSIATYPITVYYITVYYSLLSHEPGYI